MNQLSKRESFAQAAMQGMLAKCRPFSEDADAIPRRSVEFADALIAELERTAAVKDSLTAEPDADGWIPHVPGGMMPWDADTHVIVRYKNGQGMMPWDADTHVIVRYKNGQAERSTAGDFDWGRSGEYGIIAWKPIAWKPAE